MDTLNELVYVLSRKKPMSFDQWLPKTSKTRKLFDAIEKNMVTTDDEAAKAVYNTSPGDKKFIMLKKNLKDKLFEMILVSSENNKGEASTVVSKFSLKKKLAVTELLLTENVYHNAEKILSRTLQEARNLNYTDVEIEAVRQLRTLYFLKGVPSETVNYYKELKRLIDKLEYEQKTEAMWQILMSDKKYILQATQAMIEKAEDYLREINQYSEESGSALIKLYEIKIRLFLARNYGKHKKTQEVLSEFKDILYDNPSLNNTQEQLELQLGYARYYRDTGKLNEAEGFVKKSLQLSDYKAFNKFEIRALHVDILFKTENIDAIYPIIKEVASTAQFEFLHTNDKAFWYLMEGYLVVAFSLRNKTYKSPVFTIYQSKNIVQSLENECKSISKDKAGYHLQFIVLKLLLLIIQSGYTMDWDAGFINMYVQRYLKKSREKQTINFLKLLIRVAGIGFEVVEKEKLQKMFRKIENLEDKTFDVCEVLPYVFIINNLLSRVKPTTEGSSDAENVPGKLIASGS